MSTDDTYPDPVKQAVEYARDELDNDFAPNPADYYENESQWNASTNGSQKTYSGLGVFVDRDEHSDTQGDEEWKVEVRMASQQSANPLLVADGLTDEEMQNVIRAFQYRLDSYERQGYYEPNYKRKD